MPASPPRHQCHPPSSLDAHNVRPSICRRRAQQELWTPARLSEAATAPALRRRRRCPPAAAAPFLPLMALLSWADDAEGSRVAAEGAARRRLRVAATRTRGEDRGRSRRAAVHPRHLTGLSAAAAAPRGGAVGQPAVLGRRSHSGAIYCTASTSLSAESRATAATRLRGGAVFSSGGRESLSPSRPPTSLLPHSCRPMPPSSPALDCTPTCRRRWRRQRRLRRRGRRPLRRRRR